jgi:hypothetical protein
VIAVYYSDEAAYVANSATVSDWEAPRIIDGRWLLAPPVGDGGMSEVYRATDIDHEYGPLGIDYGHSLKWVIIGSQLADWDRPAVVGEELEPAHRSHTERSLRGLAGPVSIS